MSPHEHATHNYNDNASPHVEIRAKEIPSALSGLQGESRRLEQVFDELITALTPVTRPPGQGESAETTKKQLYETEYGQSIGREIDQLIELRERMEHLIARLEV